MPATSNPPNDTNTTLQNIKDTIAVYQAERGWDKLDPRDLAISITIEAAELMEHYQWENSDTTSDDHKQGIADELADILTYCIEFALATGIDISSAFHSKLERVKQKYPTTLFHPGHLNAEAYRNIKKAYRSDEPSASNE